MKPNYDQLIWEACGSPMREDKSYILHPTLNHPDAKIMKLIDITLAHVMQLLYEKRTNSFNLYKIYVEDKKLIIYDSAMRLRIELISIKENNEAANFADQSEETKEAICKVVGLV